MKLPQEVEETIMDNSSSTQKLSAVMDRLSEDSNKQIFVRWKEKFLEYKEPIPDTLEVPDTKLFLGFSSLDYRTDNAVMPEANVLAQEGGDIVPKSRCYTILA